MPVADWLIAASAHHLPSPARAERNQRRKVAFIPVRPVVAGVVVVIALIVFTR
jgi:hypothetical protein